MLQPPGRTLPPGSASGDVDAAPAPAERGHCHDNVRIEVLLTDPAGPRSPPRHPLAACDQSRRRVCGTSRFVAAPADTGWWLDSGWHRRSARATRSHRTVTDQHDSFLTAIRQRLGIALTPESPPSTTRAWHHLPPVTASTPPKASSALAGRPPAMPTPLSGLRPLLPGPKPPQHPINPSGLRD